jgi:hypothetical protein
MRRTSVKLLAGTVAVVLMSISLAVPSGALATTASVSGAAGCTRTADPDWSVARTWDEAMLDAIRRALPAPTLHARNLFHVSAAMWDAWAAYDPGADGYFVDEKLAVSDVQGAREEAISYAAYRILTERYATAVGAEESLAEFDQTMASLCYDPSITTTTGPSPAALGNRIAAAAIEYGLADGSNEAGGYEDPTYTPVNAPLIVKRPGAKMKDPNRWQPLALDEQIAQNNVPIPDKVQTFVGPGWGHVRSFGLPASATGVPIDPGAPPRLGDPGSDKLYKKAAVDIIARSSLLDAADTTTLDISPASLGNDDLGTNNGKGYSINPVTGEPYAPDVVRRSDYLRTLVEFWADGPRSETPPGHWNVIANEVGDTPGFAHRIGGTGPVVDRLEWDVKTYLALNGAVHDAAVAAWGVKGYYDSARPISMIRYMAGHGQSSRKDLPNYDPRGLPLVPGLVELITPQSAAPGQRHHALRKKIGQVAIRAWAGNPADPATQDAGVEWQLATTWLPYQKDTFVTPAFAAYVSGHSSFSRAAAEVMTRLTGSAYFPGGLSEWVIPAGSLEVEKGPSEDVTLQWATYYDAADQAGISRLYGGIHIPQDDLAGRITGAQCGKDAWTLATKYFTGTARG